MFFSCQRKQSKRFITTKQFNLNSNFLIMAFVERIIETDKNLDEILQEKRKNGTRYIKVHKTAAITIQRYYRGYYTRLYLSKLNLAAKIIQKYWKGYVNRRYNDNNNCYYYKCSVNK